LQLCEKPQFASLKEFWTKKGNEAKWYKTMQEVQSRWVTFSSPVRKTIGKENTNKIVWCSKSTRLKKSSVNKSHLYSVPSSNPNNPFYQVSNSNIQVRSKRKSSTSAISDDLAPGTFRILQPAWHLPYCHDQFLNIIKSSNNGKSET
jgi:hypothetical protein